MPTNPTTPLDHWLSLFKAPFHHSPECGYIFDAEPDMVAEANEDTDGVLKMRGWGRIINYAMTIHKNYEEAEALAIEIQNAGAKWTASAMNEKYNKEQP